MKRIKFNNPGRKVGIAFEKIEQFLIKDFFTLDEVLEANNGKVHERKNVIIELALSRHANSYALIGAELIPPNSETENSLSIEVRYNNGNTGRYNDHFGILSENVFYGLLKEYADFVLTAAKEYFNEKQLHAGKIIFSMAAYCDYCSAPDIFGKTTKILLHILFNNYDKTTNEELKQICDKYLL